MAAKKIFFLFSSLIPLSMPVFAEQTVLPPVDCLNIGGNDIYSSNPLWFNAISKPQGEIDLFTIGALREFQDSLSDYGKDLFLLFTPRPVIYLPQALMDTHEVDVLSLKAEYSSRVRDLQASGLQLFDYIKIAEPYQNEISVQRKADHHWTSEGSLMAAFELARLINAEPDHSDVQYFLDEVAGLPRSDLVLSGETLWQSSSNGNCDLSNYYITERNYDLPDKISNDAIESALFGDVSNSIALFGTSFSTSVRNQFERALQYFTGTSVIGYQMSGGGAATGLFTHIGDVVQDSSVDHVVWEFNDLHASSLIAGAASLASGIISGACEPSDPLFRWFEASGQYQEWLEVPDFVGGFDTLQVYAPWDVTAEFELTYTSPDNETLVGRGSAFLRGMDTTNTPHEAWTFGLPDYIKEDMGMSLSAARIRLMPYVNGNTNPQGPVTINVAGCMKLDSQRLAAL